MLLDIQQPVVNSEWDAVFTVVEDYYWLMAARGRLLRLEGTINGLCTFFLLSSEQEAVRFHARPPFTTPIDDGDGSVIYIDYLLAAHFNRLLFRAVEQVLTKHVPQWRTAIWYRPGRQEDRRYTYRRRVSHGADV